MFYTLRIYMGINLRISAGWKVACREKKSHKEKKESASCITKKNPIGKGTCFMKKEIKREGSGQKGRKIRD